MGNAKSLLKNMEKKGLAKRQRSSADERNVNVIVTEQGESLREKAITIPVRMGQCINLDPEDANSFSGLYSSHQPPMIGME